MPDTPSSGQAGPRQPAEIEFDPAETQPAGADPDDEPLWRYDEPEVDRPARAPRSPRRRRIALGAALTVGLVGAAAIGTVGWRIADQKDATLETPEQVAGLVRDDSERARATADYLRTGFAADIDLEQSIGAVYADPAAADRSVLLFGGTALIWQPSRDLDRLFGLVADDGESVQGLRELPAGELGGVLKCGSNPADEADLTVCGWADHGSVVLAMFPGRPMDESAALLREIRSTIQTRH